MDSKSTALVSTNFSFSKYSLRSKQYQKENFVQLYFSSADKVTD